MLAAPREIILALGPNYTMRVNLETNFVDDLITPHKIRFWLAVALP